MLGYKFADAAQCIQTSLPGEPHLSFIPVAHLPRTPSALQGMSYAHAILSGQGRLAAFSRRIKSPGSEVLFRAEFSCCDTDPNSELRRTVITKLRPSYLTSRLLTAKEHPSRSPLSVASSKASH